MANEVILETNMGNITVELDNATPATTENFLNYVKTGFYNNTIFHRVINKFVIQGGGLDENMVEKETQAPIKNEAKAGLLNKKGTIAMARTNAPHSATSQFFINLADNDFLNHTSEDMHGWGYCAFGKVTSGMDIVEAIGETQTTFKNGHSDVPEANVTLISATVR